MLHAVSERDAQRPKGEALMTKNHSKCKEDQVTYVGLWDVRFPAFKGAINPAAGPCSALADADDSEEPAEQQG